MNEWTGEIDLAPTWAIFAGNGGITRRHAHLAHKLVIGVDDGASVHAAEEIAPRAWFVRSAWQHAVVAPGRVVLVFFDAGSFARDLVSHAEAMARVVPTLRVADAEGRVRAVSELARALPALRDARVARASAILRRDPRLRVSEIAGRVRLSSTRLTHLFTERIGAAPRRYRTWGTLRRAVELMGSGRLLTEVAHEAGFSDAAHLSRAFVAMLGIPPSALASSCTVRLRDG